MTAFLPQLLASHGGFGLNLNVFDTNIINLAIVIAGLVWFLRGFLGGILERRRTAILTDLKEAEERLTTASPTRNRKRSGSAPTAWPGPTPSGSTARSAPLRRLPA
jgi:F-type H+-transporting ATPase subunit b